MAGNRFADCGIEELVIQLVGAGSMCWVGGTGDLEFDSTAALAVAGDGLGRLNEILGGGSVGPPTPEPACQGFRWVGQSFTHCEGCGQPYWEHTHDTRMRTGAGPFDDDPFDYVPITDAQKAACKAKWGTR